MHGRASLLHRFFDVHDSRQRVVLDLDQRRRVGGLISLVRDHDRNWLALVDDLVMRDGELVGYLLLLSHERSGHRDSAGNVVLEVRIRVNGLHTGRLLGFGRIDGADLGVGIGASHNSHVGHARARHVVDVPAVPRDQTRVFAAVDLGSDHGRDRHVSSFLRWTSRRAWPSRRPWWRPPTSPT